MVSKLLSLIGLAEQKGNIAFVAGHNSSSDHCRIIELNGLILASASYSGLLHTEGERANTAMALYDIELNCYQKVMCVFI